MSLTPDLAGHGDSGGGGGSSAHEAPAPALQGVQCRVGPELGDGDHQEATRQLG